jgi:indole-3-glycerol phosphate synthase
MILDDIVKNTREELALRKVAKPLETLKAEVRALPKKDSSFLKALEAAPFAVIAEIKRRSPSKGVLREDFDPVLIAREYEANGAAALSVLTDKKFFGGSSDYLELVRQAVCLPLLRKDFVVEEYHIWESRLLGADAVLLIADILSAHEIANFQTLAAELGMDALVEVHSQKDVEKALEAKPRLLGINNRDLHTFWTDIKVTERLAREVPKGIFLVSESGIQNHEDLIYLKDLGVHAALVGESLMRQKSLGEALKALLGDFRAR